MALDQSALLEVLDALKAADVGDRVRTAAETVYQALIEAELTDTIGAALHERSDTRTNLRNGHRTRTLSTTAGDLELRIPKLRTGSFFPSLLERRRRVDQALFAVVMEAYLHGVSTRKVDDLVKALGADTGISKSEVSRICADLDTEVGAFRDRSLAEQAFPYVFLDATYCKARVNHRVVSQAVVIATGVRADGWREVLGFAVGDSEDGAFWTAFLRSLKARGLGGVQLVISDAHTGLKQAISAVLLGAAWQRCRVHCDCKETTCSSGTGCPMMRYACRRRGPWSARTAVRGVVAVSERASATTGAGDGGATAGARRGPRRGRGEWRQCHHGAQGRCRVGVRRGFIAGRAGATGGRWTTTRPRAGPGIGRGPAQAGGTG
jgi:Transposase, Mutator family